VVTAVWAVAAARPEAAVAEMNRSADDRREMLRRYSGAIGGGGHREEMGYGLPGAAGELEGAQ